MLSLIRLGGEHTHTLYDKTLLGSPSITVKADLSEDKSMANITSSYDFSSYPQQLGGEYLMNFEVRNKNGDLVLSSSDSLQYIGRILSKGGFLCERWNVVQE